jgi:hypothetical protein
MAPVVFANSGTVGWAILACRPIWLWIPAFLVMGIGCIANAARCGRLHCYVTGPLYILAAAYVTLFALHVAPLNRGIFLLAVLGVSYLLQGADAPLGTYRTARK